MKIDDTVKLTEAAVDLMHQPPKTRAATLAMRGRVIQVKRTFVIVDWPLYPQSRHWRDDLILCDSTPVVSTCSVLHTPDATKIGRRSYWIRHIVRRPSMNNIIWLVGAVVIVIIVLGFLGLR
jgi:hypothetical protein